MLRSRPTRVSKVTSGFLAFVRAGITRYRAEAVRDWQTRRKSKQERLRAVAPFMDGVVLDPDKTVEALQMLLRPGDRVALEGDNQKQADFLARSLAAVDPAVVHDLHMLISSISLPEHLDLFERGIASKLDLSFAGPQSVRMAQMVGDGTVEVGAIHTYVELYARMFVDLIPSVVLLCGAQADREGNLFTGPNTEDTPTIAEAAAFSDGVVVAQVNEVVDEVPRVDIPGGWVDVIVQADQAVLHGAAVHARSTPYRRRRDSAGDARDPRDLRAPRSAAAEPWDGLRYGRHRADPADVRGAARPPGQDLQAVDAQPAPDVDPGDRVGMGRVDPFVRWRGRHGALRRGPTGHLLHRTRWQPAVESRAVPARGPVRDRHVHRVVAPARRRRQLLDRDRGTARRFRWCAEHGPRPSWPPP